MATKYKIQPHHIEERGGIERLRHDGFTREDISKAMYKHTEGIHDKPNIAKERRTAIMDKLHERER